MSDAEIEQAMQDAREYAGQDQLRRDALELIGDAQKAAVQARRVLKEQDKIMDKARKKQLKKDVSVLEKHCRRSGWIKCQKRIWPACAQPCRP